MEKEKDALMGLKSELQKFLEEISAKETEVRSIHQHFKNIFCFMNDNENVSAIKLHISAS